MANPDVLTAGTVGSTGSGGASTSPAAVIPNDPVGSWCHLVLMCSASATISAGLPTGASLLESPQVGANQTLRVYEFQLIAGQPGSTVTLTLSTGNLWEMQFITFSHATAAVAHNNSNSASATTTPSFPAATPTADNQLVMAYMAVRDGVNADTFNATAGTSYTEVTDDTTTRTGANNNNGLYAQKRQLGSSTSGVSQTPGAPTYNHSVTKAAATVILGVGNPTGTFTMTEGGAISFTGKKGGLRATLFSSTEGGAPSFTGQQFDHHETFEAVGVGVAITTSNTSFDAVTGAGTALGASTGVAAGSRAAKLAISGNSQYFDQNVLPTDGKTRYARFYITPDSSVGSGIPSATEAILVGRYDSTPTNSFDVQWMVTTGFLRLRNGNGTSQGTSALALVPDELNRIEVELVPTTGNAGALHLKAWLGNNHAHMSAAQLAPDIDITGTTAEARTNLMRLGFPSNATATARIDEWAESNSGWIGPAQHVAATSFTMTEGGAISFTGVGSGGGGGAISFQENFGAMTTGDTVSASTTAFDAAAGTATWTSTPQRHGSVGKSTYIHATSNNRYAEHDETAVGGTTHFFRFYIEPDSSVDGGTPSIDTNILALYETVTTNISTSVRWASTGSIILRDSSNIARVTTGTTVLALDQRNRIEVGITPGSSGTLGNMRLKIWKGDAHCDAVSSPDTDVSMAADQLSEARINGTRFGLLNNTIAAAHLYDFAESLTGWVGPRAAFEAHSQTFDTASAEGGDFGSFIGQPNKHANGKLVFHLSLTGSAHASELQFSHPMPALSGGGAIAFTGRKGAKRNIGALSGGGIITVGTLKNAKRAVLFAGQEGGQIQFLGLRNDGVKSGALTFREGGDWHFTGRKNARRALPPISDGYSPFMEPSWDHDASHTAAPVVVLSGGGDFLVVGRKGALTVVTLREGGDWHLTTTGTGNPTTGLLRLVWPVTIDDHLRPDPSPTVSALWQHMRLPMTQTGLLVYRDGTVIPTDSWLVPAYDTADAKLAGGSAFVAPPDDWRVQVLLAAGYTFEAV